MKTAARRRQVNREETRVSYRKALWSGVAIVALLGFWVLYLRREAGANLIPVRGRVTIDGQPLTKGLVVFYPNEKKGNRGKQEPRGKIDNDGDYELFSREGHGVPAGWYRVCVVVVEHRNARNGVHGRPLPIIETKYLDPKKSTLEVEVRPNAPQGAYDLTVKGNPQKGKKP